MWNKPKYGNEHGGRPYKEGGAFHDLNARILPSTMEWIRANGGGKVVRSLIDKAMAEQEGREV